MDKGITDVNQRDSLYEICKIFIELADKALLSKEIDFSSYAELTQLKYSYMKDYEIEIKDLLH